MKMKKILTVLVSLMLCAAVSVSLVGCNRGSQKIDADGNVTLTFWSIYPTGDTGHDWIEGLIDDFEAQYKAEHGTTVTIEHQGTSFWDYFTKIGTAQTSPTGPDIYMHTTTDNAARAEGGISMDISGYFTENGLNASIFSEGERDALTTTVDGEEGVYGVPWQTDGRMLYFNVEHLNELKNTTDADWLGTQAAEKGYGITGKPADLVGDVDWDGDEVNDVRGPKTWGELMAYAELLTQEENGSITRLGFHFDVGNNSILNLIWNKGGKVFDEDGNPIVVVDGKADPIIEEAYQTWYDINRIFPARQTNGFIEGSGSTDTNNLFYTGQVSMMIATNEIPWKNEDLGEDVKDDGTPNTDTNPVPLGVCAIPYADLDNPEDRANFSGGFSLEITNRLLDYDERVAQAAYEFLEFMMSDEVQLSIVDNITNMPGSTAVYDQLEEAETDPVKQFVFQEMAYRRPMDYISNAANWINDLTNNLTEFVSGQKDLATALQEAQDDIERRQATA